MGMLLALTYRMVEADRFTCAGHFKQEQTLALMGVGCPGNTVGLIGLGKVARFMVPRIGAFDMHIFTRPPQPRGGKRARYRMGGQPRQQRSDFVYIEPIRAPNRDPCAPPPTRSDLARGLR
jgi:phosphoglycerate dehydrogenase-like enzyme